MIENELIDCAIHCMKSQAGIEQCENCKAYDMDDSTCKEIAREAFKALEEIKMYRDGKLFLIPENVFKRQCEELDAYKELGTVEKCREAINKQEGKIKRVYPERVSFRGFNRKPNTE